MATKIDFFPHTLISASITGAGTAFDLKNKKNTFQATANGTSGAFSATVDVEVSNDETNWITMGTISLAGTATTANSDGFTSDSAWAFIRGNITAISGTGATATLVMGI